VVAVVLSVETTGRVRRFGGKVRPWHAVAVAAALLVTVGGVLWVPTASAATCKYPAQVLNLTNWKLQTPFSNGSGGVLEIKQPALATYTKAPYFANDPNNCSAGVGFRAPVNGAHTSGSHYARSELREMTNDGKTNASWSSIIGTHTFTETIAFKELPKVKPDVVGAQIHNAAEDISLLVLRGTKLYVTDAGAGINKLVNSNYTLGTKIDMRWVVSGGVTKAYVNNVLQVTFNRIYDGAYFKAGAYPQASCDNSSPCSSTNGGATTITKLAVIHSGATAVSQMLAPVTGPVEEGLNTAMGKSNGE
jgi:hypothetical protein